MDIWPVPKYSSEYATVQYMSEYVLSLTCIFSFKNIIYYFVLVGENTGQRKPLFWYI